MDDQEIIQKIINNIHENKFYETLNILNDFEKNYSNEKNFNFCKAIAFIEIGYGMKDAQKIHEGIDLCEKLINDSEFENFKYSLYYKAANGYYDLYNLCERNCGLEGIINSENPLNYEKENNDYVTLKGIINSKNLQKSKEYYRKALDSDNNIEILKQLYTNFGNCLDMLGRRIEAIDMYNKVLKFDKNFSMAIGNKAIALFHFASISGYNIEEIYIIIYQDLKSIINNKDITSIGEQGSIDIFTNYIKKIEESFDNNIDKLNQKIQVKKFNEKKLSKFEKFYNELCLKEDLFLNFRIYDIINKESFEDPIFINIYNKIGKTDERANYLIEYINQIKEDYIAARLFFVLSQYKNDVLNNISRKTTFVYPLNYSNFNLYYGLLKSAFIKSYNILDKIANFINIYLNLDRQDDKVNFKNIWDEDLINIISNSRNCDLYALYDIKKDFDSGFYNNINKIRNSLTHRKLVVFELNKGEFKQKKEIININDKNEYIDLPTLEEETIKILKLLKSAIIYLINFVNIEESKKRNKNNNNINIKLYFDTTQFL